jgi:hypothetical protein
MDLEKINQHVEKFLETIPERLRPTEPAFTYREVYQRGELKKTVIVTFDPVYVKDIEDLPPTVGGTATYLYGWIRNEFTEDDVYHYMSVEYTYHLTWSDKETLRMIDKLIEVREPESVSEALVC